MAPKPIQDQILTLLAKVGTPTAASIADTLGIPLEDLNAILRDGRQQGFIIRDWSDEQRCVCYTLTSKGRSAAAELAPGKQAKQGAIDRIEELECRLAKATQALLAASALLDELSAPEMYAEPMGYMVSRDGCGAPSVIHASVELAAEEAGRIAGAISQGTIRILEVIDVLTVTCTHTKSMAWASDTEEAAEAVNA